MAEEGDRDQVLGYIEHRFGIPRDLFDDFLLFRRKKSWWILRNTPHVRGAFHLKVVMAGLRAFQRVGRFLKPTTRFMQVFGHHATRSIIAIGPGDLAALRQGETLAGGPGLTDGYVLLSFHHQVLGLGLLVEGRILSQLPRGDIPTLTT